MKCKPSLLMGVYCIVLRGLVVAVMSKRLRKHTFSSDNRVGPPIALVEPQPAFQVKQSD